MKRRRCRSCGYENRQIRTKCPKCEDYMRVIRGNDEEGQK